MGAHNVRLSGRLDMFKGDVKSERLLVDCKYTDKPSYVLTADVWDAVAGWARNESKEPAIAIKTSECEIAVVSEPLYYELEEHIKPIVEWEETKSRTLGQKVDQIHPTRFNIGGYHLMAYSFEKFVDDVRRTHGQ